MQFSTRMELLIWPAYLAIGLTNYPKDFLVEGLLLQIPRAEEADLTGKATITVVLRNCGIEVKCKISDMFPLIAQKLS